METNVLLFAMGLFGVGVPGGAPAVAIPLIGTIGISLLVAPMTTGPGWVGLILLPFLLVVVLLPLALGLFLASTYFVPAGLARFADTGSVREGLAVRSVFRVVRRRAYVKYWLGTMVLTLPGVALLNAAYILAFSRRYPAVSESVVAVLLGAENIVFYAGPANAIGLLWWVFLLLSSVGYFLVLVAASRLVGRIPATPSR